jgi:hypothetical protein
MESGRAAMSRYEVLVVHSDPIMQESTLLHYQCDTIDALLQQEKDLATFHSKCEYSYVVLMTVNNTPFILGAEDED